MLITKHLVFGFLFYIALFNGFELQANHTNFVTYGDCGRLGDKLIAYLHAKWLSYQYGIPLLYKEFPYSSEFFLDNERYRFSEIKLKKFLQIPVTNHKMLRNHLKGRPVIYVLEYFPECKWELLNSGYYYFDVDWKDPGFRQIAQKMLTPKRLHPCISPPQETVNIALHYRDGGTYESRDEEYFYYPIKFPPLEFYIEGLLKIIELFPEKILYCYLFTDAVNPSEIVEKILPFLPSHSQIVFDFRHENNAHDRNVVEDFLSLFQFDVLIHPQSNFSIVPALIHDYAVTYTPMSCCMNENGRKIIQSKCNINQLLYQDALLK